MPAKTRPMSNPRAAKPRIRIVRDVENARVPVTAITRTVGEIMRKEKSAGVIQLIIVDDVTMRRLNRRFKGKDKTTDVLSFPFEDDMPGTESMHMIGEIYCNYAHCKRWIAENGGTISDELLRLAVHGCLHLFGYDHHKTEDQRRMLRAENRYLQRGGLIRTRVNSNGTGDD
jgi:probable rRNA maturation factor